MKAVARPRRGIAVIARDEGPGIADVELALTDGFSTSNSLGLGLPGVKRLMDRVHIRSKPGHGTMVVAWKWMAPALDAPGLARAELGARASGQVSVSRRNPG